MRQGFIYQFSIPVLSKWIFLISADLISSISATFIPETPENRFQKIKSDNGR
jgi:hypothetical protein